MTKREPYSYVVLRYVHDVLTGEFVNVGLVMAVPGRSLLLTRARKTFSRLKALFPDLDGEEYRRAADAVLRALKVVEQAASSEGLFKSDRTALDHARIAVPLDDSALQWSPLGSGLTGDPQKTFEQLYARFVTRYDRPAQMRRTDDDVWRVVAGKLKEREVKVELEPKLIVGSTDTVEFGHAWKNGRWHAYEPLSFDLADADNIKDKARKWLGHLSAVHDGAIEDVQVHFIVGRPRSEALVPAYRSAIEILKRIPFDNDVFEEEQVDEVVNRLEDEVREHERSGAKRS